MNLAYKINKPFNGIMGKKIKRNNNSIVNGSDHSKLLNINNNNNHEMTINQRNDESLII